MRKIVVIAAFAALGSTACAEIESSPVEISETQIDQIRYVEGAEVTADDGRVFIVEVGFDGTIAPDVVSDIIENIAIVGVDGITPVDEGPVFDGFAPEHGDGVYLIPLQPGLDLSLSPRDPDSFIDDSPWYMVEGVDPRDLARPYEDACPAWH